MLTGALGVRRLMEGQVLDGMLKQRSFTFYMGP